MDLPVETHRALNKSHLHIRVFLVTESANEFAVIATPEPSFMGLTLPLKMSFYSAASANHTCIAGESARFKRRAISVLISSGGMTSTRTHTDSRS